MENNQQEIEVADAINPNVQLSMIQKVRIAKWEAIKKQIDLMSNDPEKIFNTFNFKVQQIDGVELSGSGYKKIFCWRGKEYKRPELVAKAYYESMGYSVTWSEGVAWGIIINSLIALLCIKMGKYFRAKDTRSQELEWALSAAKHKQFQFEIHDCFGPPLYIERAYARVEQSYEERIEKLQGKNGKYEFHLRTLINYIYDLDNTSFDKFLETLKLETDLDINALKARLIDAVKELSMEKNLEALEIYYPEVGAQVFNEYRDKYNLTEWTIKFAKEALARLNWENLYNNFLERNGRYAARFDLTVIDFETDAIKFVEVKVDDKLTEFQLQDVIDAVQYQIPIELAIIK